MGWWPFSGNNKTSTIDAAQEVGLQQDNAKTQPVFLEDIPARFPEETQTQGQGSNNPHPQDGFSVSKEVKSFVSTLTPEHFFLSNLVQIPCFREAGLSGFSCFFVFSSVLYVYHRSLRKAVNWGFGGLLLGSIFGWEHCNNTRRNSQMAVKLAQERFEKKRNESNSGNN